MEQLASTLSTTYKTSVGSCRLMLIWRLHVKSWLICVNRSQPVDVADAPDVTHDTAGPRKSKHRQRVTPTPDVASPAAVASPVSAIERLDNLIKVCCDGQKADLEFLRLETKTSRDPVFRVLVSRSRS